MIGRVILAALLAGIAAGLVMGLIQHVRLTPLILQAETFEAPSHEHADEGFKPADGWQRTSLTTLNSAALGAGYAAILVGLSLVAGIALNRRNGVSWGLCGFLAVTLAPSAGLPPELPGMPVADLAQRQLWWIATILATGIGIYLIATGRALWAIPLIAAPHLIGAPVAAGHESAVPAHLAAAFTASSIAANAIFWLLIGAFTGIAMDKIKS